MMKMPRTKSRKVTYAALIVASLSLFLFDKRSTAVFQTRILNTLSDTFAIAVKAPPAKAAIARKNDDDGESHNDKSPNTTFSTVSKPSRDKKSMAKTRARKRLTQQKILQHMNMTEKGNATNEHSVHVLDNDNNTISKDARFDVERAFNRHNFGQHRKLINASSALLWAADYFEPLKSLFGDELGLVPLDSPERQFQIWNDTTHDLIHEGCLCYAVQHFQMTESRKDHVLLVHFNENWGALSGYVPNRTVDWGTMEGTLGYCGLQQVLEYLANSHTRAVFTVQHQQIDHPKVHSMPLGIQSPTTVQALVEILQKEQPTPRTQLAYMNFNNNSATRGPQMETLLRNFNGTIQNMYPPHGPTLEAQQHYYQGLETSKFVFSPAGLGWDCYRVWEVLSFGAIPVIEHYNRTDGWFRTLSDLPVLWVSSFDVVTPQLLENEYVRIAARYKEYKYEKLTKQWWIDFVNSFRVTAAATAATIK